MTDKEIIDASYKEILKQIFKTFHLDQDEKKFKAAVDYLRKTKRKAETLL
jgi:meiotically up-regulated gene 157 (Mug157) protein